MNRVLSARRLCQARLAACLSCLCACATSAVAQTTREPVMIPVTKHVDASALDSGATGFFVNESGDVLTARHVVEGCQSLFVIKDAQVARAKVRAVSAEQDLAVLVSGIRPLLAASFAKTVDVSSGQPLFAAGYKVLRHMSDRATTMYNALARSGPTGMRRSGKLTLLSSAVNGASGSPVLNQAGLVVGLVTDRAQTSNEDPRAFVTRSGPASYVIAVSGDAIKAFLDANRVPFVETNVPQLEPMQAHAPRAATVEVGVLCGR
jgi:serine protease Do